MMTIGHALVARDDVTGRLTEIRVPTLVIVGDQEVAARKVAVRTRKGEDLGQMSLADFVSRLRTEEARLGRAARD